MTRPDSDKPSPHGNLSVWLTWMQKTRRTGCYRLVLYLEKPGEAETRAVMFGPVVGERKPETNWKEALLKTLCVGIQSLTTELYREEKNKV